MKILSFVILILVGTLVLAGCSPAVPGPAPEEAAEARAAQDWPRMIGALEAGAEAGDPYAMLGLADVLRYGLIHDAHGVAVGSWPQHADRAHRLYRDAADRLAGRAEDPVAQTTLGKLHWEGLGVTQDWDASARLWEAAAAQDEPEALYALGWFVHRNHDDARAAGYLREAAALGHPAARYALYLAYRDGHGGVPADPDQATMWLTAAAADGYAPAVRERDLALAAQ